MRIARRITGAALVAALSGGTSLAQTAAPAQPTSPFSPSSPTVLYGRPISRLTFRGDAPADEAILRPLTELRAGQVLTESSVRTSMRNLFATRRFSDLTLEATPTLEGVSLAIVFSSVPRIASLKMLGDRIPERGRLRDSIRVDAGDPWLADEGQVAEVTLKRLLKERGYFDATVETRVEAGPDETSVDVRFQVVPGPRALTAPPIWKGSIGTMDPARLAKTARMKTGRPYREARAREDADRFAALFHKKGYARAEVRFDGDLYDPKSRRAAPQYIVFVGPLVVLVVEGASDSDVRKHPDSPWSRGEPPDEDAIRRLADSLKRSYQEKGYARVRVETSFATSESKDTITVKIDRGERWTVGHVDFSGMHDLTVSQLESVVQTQPRGFLEVGRLVDKRLEDDRNALAGLYSSQGFTDARLRKAVVRDGAQSFTLDVTFPVEEGPRLFVSRLSIEGAKAIPAAELEGSLGVKPGQPYDPS
ncbi:MAG: POTRA domain-containing protein, partial [Thermoanaerobaculia bacterium]